MKIKPRTKILYGVENKAALKVIKRTFTQLPAEVARFVNENCMFVASHSKHISMMLALHALDWTPNCLIILDFTHMRSRWAQDIVAHEIAHAWCDHSFGNAQEQEREADEQAVAWGFRSKVDCTDPSTKKEEQ